MTPRKFEARRPEPGQARGGALARPLLIAGRMTYARRDLAAFAFTPITLLCLLPACGGTTGASPPAELRSDKTRLTAPVVPADDAAELASDDLRFAVDMHQELRGRIPGNFVFSQTSISTALAMLYAGAATTTAEGMATALHFTLPQARLHPAFDALDLALTTPPAGTDAGAFRLAVANALWVQDGFTALPSYLDLLAENYGAGLLLEDFVSDPEAARAAINRWVSDQTESQIPSLFPQGSIDASTRLVLANALFFHGDWAKPFDAQSPAGTFHAPSGDVTVPMMSGDLNAALWNGSGWSAAALDYSGGTTSMVVVVPDAGTFDAFEQGLTADTLAAILAPATTRLGAVTLPKFKFETGLSLQQTLRALGMQDAFVSGAADFSGIDGARDLFVGAVIHKAIIAVDEKGTTAAAATGVTVRTAAVVETLAVDRPFLFFIRHQPTGAILFQGRVLNPAQ